MVIASPLLIFLFGFSIFFPAVMTNSHPTKAKNEELNALINQPNLKCELAAHTAKLCPAFPTSTGFPSTTGLFGAPAQAIYRAAIIMIKNVSHLTIPEALPILLNHFIPKLTATAQITKMPIPIKSIHKSLNGPHTPALAWLTNGSAKLPLKQTIIVKVIEKGK
jgi:hypothetical protein